MAKIVNCWNEWDPLKRVIVGRPEGTNVPAPEPAWWYDFPVAESQLPGSHTTKPVPAQERSYPLVSPR